MTDRIKYTTNIVLGLLFVVLVIAGVNLIIESGRLYNKSVSLTQSVLTANANKQSYGVLPNYTVVKEGYAQALSFFMLAIGCILVLLLLPRLTSLSIGPSGVNLSLQALQQNVDNLMQQNNLIQATSAGVGGGISGTSAQAAQLLTEETRTFSSSKQSKKIIQTGDSQKGKWGGASTRNFRKLCATVKKSDTAGMFVVDLIVESTEADFPLNGVVKFHLDHSFSNHNPIIAVQNGKAFLELRKVIGPFTVGAETDKGKTSLELDLSTIDGFEKK